MFFTTSSPNGTYSVSLKGDKGRPLIMRNEVRVDVSKVGQPFISDIWLHSAEDSFDLSFEAGFPEVRWRADNIVEFYRAQDFDAGRDSLLVENKASKPVRYLRIQSKNKFLLFEVHSGASVSLDIPAPRGDSQWIALQGAFADGSEIPFSSKSFEKRFSRKQHSIYQVSVGESNPTIQVKD